MNCQKAASVMIQYKTTQIAKLIKKLEKAD